MLNLKRASDAGAVKPPTPKVVSVSKTMSNLRKRLGWRKLPKGTYKPSPDGRRPSLGRKKLDPYDMYHANPIGNIVGKRALRIKKNLATEAKIKKVEAEIFEEQMSRLFAKVLEIRNAPDASKHAEDEEGIVQSDEDEAGGTHLQDEELPVENDESAAVSVSDDVVSTESKADVRNESDGEWQMIKFLKTVRETIDESSVSTTRDEDIPPASCAPQTVGSEDEAMCDAPEK